MKIKLTFIAVVLFASYANNVHAQANQTLSNLTSPTAVNQSLLPGTTNALDLGSNTKRWKNIYLGTGIYLKTCVRVNRIC